MFTISFTMIDPHGAEVTFTLGDGANLDEVMRVAQLRLQLVPMLTGKGYKVEAQAEAILPQPPAATPPAPAAPVVGNALTFLATEIEAETKGEKTYFKVKGDKFPKHGVRVWPEVLQAAGLRTEACRLSNFTAYYTEQPGKEPGDVARKVVRLEPF